ncbi:hypothetical protein HOY80DRAFT_1007583 [Tuber brumale]|nr:hypothetical protein HOY80DRAFT_1007583 [Tuber brumale]
MTVMEIGDQRNMAIIGGGIICYITAHYLTRHKDYGPNKHRITVMELIRIARGASGKAGTLLAVWAYPNNILPLSFKGHQDLVTKHGSDETWCYTGVSCGNLEAIDSSVAGEQSRGKWQAGSGKSRGSGLLEDLDWVVPSLVESYGNMGSSKDNAQVHPDQFTMSMVRLADRREGPWVTCSDTRSGFPYTIPTTTRISATGPGAAHSVPVTPSSPVEVDEARSDDSIALVSSISDWIRLGHLTCKQGCYLPILNVGGSGGPLIGETGTEGLLMAAGHSHWGLNNTPAPEKLPSEMVFEGQAVSVDRRQLDPRRIH